MSEADSSSMLMARAYHPVTGACALQRDRRARNLGRFTDSQAIAVA
jgi:hypothetical protein